MRIQDGAEANREIFLVQIMPFAQLSDVDDDARDSGEFALQNLVLFFVVSYFLATGLSEYGFGNICGTCRPHPEHLEQETRNGRDIWQLACQRSSLEQDYQRHLDHVIVGGSDHIHVS